ncbi:OmpW/AlkL family protein [Methylobacterium sp. J-070]|uniref:OmpW/AlkL family protein n=1 Tax=Methylobacterium sp. J-070 TaxID=2836650 RepID=UPI001FBBDF60|nr:OmpW family outer membrane protein [Methylobacterium sp. J-070]MCJ2050661.1 OmpW family protein [Methylobacterium sp. J-070]
MSMRGFATISSSLLTTTAVWAADPADTGARTVPAVAPPSFYLHVGLAGIFNDPGARISLASTPVPGAAVKIGDRATPAAEAGYFLTPDIAMSVSGGVPPLSKVEASGALSGSGTIGKSRGGPFSATVHYHFDGLGALRPYVGAGVAALLIFADEDRLVRRYRTDDAVGPVLQAGFDLMFDSHWGVFLDIKKGFVTTTSRGYLSGLPVRSSVSLDPVVLHSGVTYRY